MIIDRKQFMLGLAMAAIVSETGSASAADPSAPAGDGEMATTPSAPRQANDFFKNSTFEFVFQTALGRAYRQAANVGKLLWISRQIRDGDFENAFLAFKAAGDEASSLAEASLAGGHKESARQAFLWAQGYYDSATYFADGSSDPARLLPTWERLDSCWSAYIALLQPAGEEVSIPYEGTALRGFFFRAPGAEGRRPLLIMNNGSDGSLLDMMAFGGAGALARGYGVLAFDGPGQGYALWKQNLHFRPDWEKVVTPVVDYALGRPEVDPRRVALLGISQGGYWVPRAVAFEKRIAAAVADPGVVDVSASWTASLPKPLVELLLAGRREAFDGYLEQGLNPASKAALRFRMRPYGFDSYFDTFNAAMSYRLADVANAITCPMLVTEPENEAFWPGQSAQLYAMLTSAKLLVPFTESDGADLHCEPNGLGIRELRIFNWLDETLARA